MYYTIGRASVYKRALQENPGLQKAVGGYAVSSLHEAHETKLRAERGGFPELPAGVYNVYELPESTKDIVTNERLTEATVIGRETKP